MQQVFQDLLIMSDDFNNEIKLFENSGFQELDEQPVTKTGQKGWLQKPGRDDRRLKSRQRKSKGRDNDYDYDYD
jgi:hypothetical protein